MRLWILLGMALLLLIGVTASVCHAYTLAAPVSVSNPSVRLKSDPPPGCLENFSTNVRVFHWINSRHIPVFDAFFLGYSFLGMGWVLIPIVFILVLRRRDLIAPLLIAVAVETVLVLVCKDLFQQPRPARMLGAANVHLLVPLYEHAFPSGDAAMAFVIAGVLQFGARHWWWKALWFLYAALIAYERIYVGVHFPLDVVAGMVIGLLTAAIGLRVTRKASQPPRCQTAVLH